MPTINIALLGGGIFATEAHLPALAKLEERSKLRAIWSRSSGSAQKASTAWRSLTGADDIDVYSETGQSSGKLEALLADTAIHAVIIALPITSQPDIILKALRAGKHVLSEKPVGASVEDARKLVRTYEAEFRPRGQVWRVAENWEVEPAHLFAAEAVKAGRIGRINSFSISSVLFVSDEGNKYFETEWRKAPQYQGGYLLDAGVTDALIQHNAAVLRTVLPSPITHLSAYTALHNPHLPPTDWLSAIARTPSGINGQILIDYGARGREAAWELRLTGSEGEVYAGDVMVNGIDSIRVDIRSMGSETRESKTFPKSGVYEEQLRFLDAIVGDVDEYNTPQGALADVALLQAALTSNGAEVDLASLI